MDLINVDNLDKLVSDGFTTFTIILFIFLFFGTGYFLVGFMFGFYDLESNFISTLAISCFIVLPFLFFEYDTYRKKYLREFYEKYSLTQIKENNQNDYLPKIDKTAFANALFSMVIYIWIIILFLYLNEFVFNKLLLISLNSFVPFLLFFFLSMSIAKNRIETKKIKNHADDLKEDGIDFLSQMGVPMGVLISEKASNFEPSIKVSNITEKENFNVINNSDYGGRLKIALDKARVNEK